MAAADVETAPDGAKLFKRVPGNWLARQIRIMNDDSTGLFPASAGSKRSYDKYNSTTHKDFVGPKEFCPDDPDIHATPIRRKRETIADILLEPRKNQMFVNWKVPPRLLTGTSSSPVQTPTKVDDEKEKKDKHVPNIPLRKASASPKQGLPQKKTQPPVDKTDAPKSARESPKQRAPPAMPRRSKTTVMETPRQRMSPATPRPAVATPRPAAATPRPAQATPRRSPTFLVTNAAKEEEAVPELKRENLTHTLQPQAVDKAEEWLKKAPEYDRHVIEKVLRMTEKKQEAENALKRSLLPDAKQTVDKWLQNANQKDRDVALKFFNSLAGSKLVGMTKEEQRKRLQQVISALETGAPKESNGPKPVFRPEESPRQNRMKYVRLLTPGTRKNRWMYTTWHHLPEYKDDNPNGNWSSHYIRPQASIPRHFSIHPDWG